MRDARAEDCCEELELGRRALEAEEGKIVVERGAWSILEEGAGWLSTFNTFTVRQMKVCSFIR